MCKLCLRPGWRWEQRDPQLRLCPWGLGGQTEQLRTLQCPRQQGFCRMRCGRCHGLHYARMDPILYSAAGRVLVTGSCCPGGSFWGPRARSGAGVCLPFPSIAFGPSELSTLVYSQRFSVFTKSDFLSSPVIRTKGTEPFRMDSRRHRLPSPIQDSDAALRGLKSEPFNRWPVQSSLEKLSYSLSPSASFINICSITNA